jgi:hypothetical protein
MKYYDLDNLPLSHSVVSEALSEYQRPNDKISYMAEKGELIPLVRGYYALGQPLDQNLYLPYITANTINGVSYVSRYTALWYYGLISERVYDIESATLRRSKEIENKIGRFTYHKVPDKTFHIGIQSVSPLPYCTFLMARPEKALCDLIWTSSRLSITSYRDMVYFLEEDQRIDLELFATADREIFEMCAEYGPKSKLIHYLIKMCKLYHR